MRSFGQNKGKVKEYWHMLGPGLTTGAADDDPSGIATYSQAGAKYGFSLLWTAVLTFPLMAMVQEMCARIGLVTGRGLAGTMRNHFPKWILYVTASLLFAANSFNIGADLAIMGKALHGLLPKIDDVIWVVVFALTGLYFEIFRDYKQYAKYLKILVVVLFSYLLTAVLVDLNWSDLGRSIISPNLSFDKNLMILLTAILGTTISPYLFFWQTSQEVEEQISIGKTTIKSREAVVTNDEDIRKMRVDVWFGMFISNLVMFFIIAVCGATLFQQGIFEIQDAQQAAEALRPLAGNAAYLLFTLGIIGTGMLAVPVLAGSSSYAISESFGWREGLYRKFRQAHAFYGVIIVSTIVGLAMNFFGLDPIKMLIYSAVLNGLIAPLILAIIVILSSNKKIMKDWRNKPTTTALGWLLTGAMGISSIITLYFILTGW